MSRKVEGGRILYAGKGRLHHQPQQQENKSARTKGKEPRILSFSPPFSPFKLITGISTIIINGRAPFFPWRHLENASRFHLRRFKPIVRESIRAMRKQPRFYLFQTEQQCCAIEVKTLLQRSSKMALYQIKGILASIKQSLKCKSPSLLLQCELKTPPLAFVSQK